MSTRRRICLLSLALLSVLVGYWLRFFAPISPSFRDVLGGVAYVVFFVLVFGATLARASSRNIAIAVLLITCVLEFLQLWHPPWLEAIRRTLAGRLLLGTTFEWKDFPPYFFG